MGGAVAVFAAVELEGFCAPLIDVSRAFGRVRCNFHLIRTCPDGVQTSTDRAVAGDYEFRGFQNFECYGAAVATSLDHVVHFLSVHADRFIFRIVRAVLYDFSVPEFGEHFDL